MQSSVNPQDPPRVSLSGAATFAAPHLSRLASNFGSDIAWRAACFEGGIAAAASQASGAFSVAVSDGLGRTSLAVDRFAIHSLCYKVQNKALHFAPRADALADRHTEIDPQAIFDYLFFHTIPSPRTVYKGIYRLPPAHCADYKNGTLAVAPYGAPAVEDTPRAHLSDVHEEFRHLLRGAVAAHMAGEKPACFLSGGTHSSTVAGMIGAVSGEPATTYSIGFAASDYGGIEAAQVAATHLGTQHQSHYLTPDDLVRSLPGLASHYDQPFGHSSALPAYHCAAMARSDGVTRILCGDGGSALFGQSLGRTRQRVLGWYGVLPGMLCTQTMEPAPATIHPAASCKPHRHGTARAVDPWRVAMPERQNLYRLLNRLGMERVFVPDFLQMVDPMAAPNRQWQSWQGDYPTSAPQHSSAMDWQQALADSELPKVCGTGALAGVDVGFPLLDQRLLDFALRLPSVCNAKGLKLRGFFKEALKGFLPEAVLRNRKQGTGLPFGLWVCQHTGLRRLATDSLRSLGERGIVRRDFISMLLKHHLHQHPGYYGEMVWLLMVLEQWLQAHAPLYQASSAY
ncbi:asparagine synthase [Rhodoferax lacus]|uniref:asparagine synthase (glutamine-hydrolyzing) n=1 Tax=Rhodoferax lacus TaxID=2184758 RepID=A0A3E1RIW9_9BURK|nr:asparagine synthase C-terminal domain-containing protein [Rhodoferax lacus]RFO98540.1 asparagine synthase [Rhodoferax lacus]